MSQWNSNPFASIGGTGSSGSGFKFSPHPTRSKSKGLTTQQVIALQLALHQHKSGSFWDEVKHAGGSAFHPVGWTLDKLMRPLYGVAGGLTEGQLKQNENAKKGESMPGWRGNVFEAMGKGFLHGFEGKTHHTSSDFLRADPHTAGWAKKHRIQAGIAGFGLDVAADPLTYVTGGAARVLTKSAEHANLVKAGQFALHGPDHVESLKQAQQALARGGKDYSARHALAGERLSQLAGDGANAGAADRLHIAQNVAQAETKRVEKFLPQYHIGSRGKGIPITPTRLGGVRVVPALPKLDNAIAKTPIGSAALEGFRNKFIRAADETPEAHAARITRQHIQEAHAQENLHIVRDTMRGVDISEAKALKALHYGETAKNFILKTSRGNYRINEGAIVKLVREGKLDESQVLFLRRWFKATELLHLKDKALGVSYHHTGEAGKLYVPHLVDKLGRPLTDLQKNTLTKATFQHSRGKGNLSVLQMAEKAKAGELGRGVETNPFMLLAHTARARAQKQADVSLATTYAKGFGFKTRIVDEAKLAKTKSAIEQLAIDHNLHTEGQADAMAAAHHAEQDYLHNHEQTFSTKLDELNKQLRSHKFRNNHRLKAANVARIQKKLIKLHEGHIGELEQITKGKHAGLNAHLAGHLELASQHTDAINQIADQQKRLETVLKRVTVGKANRGVYSKVKHVTVPGLVDEHGHPLAFDPEVGNAVTKYTKIASGDDQALEDFSKGWRKYMAKWKLAVTSVNPGYRVRNSMSDVWAMYLMGVPMHQVPVYAGKAYHLARTARRVDTPEGRAAAAKITEAYHHGILSGLYQGDVQAVAGFIKYSGTKKALVKQGHPLQAATKMMQDFNANVENLGRMTHYLYRREVMHESATAAALKVKAAHFDYEDLTPFEQRKMKAIAPFYTWTRKNLPFQVKALASAPGRFATLPKFMAESEQASGGDPGNILPSYVQQGLGFQIPYGKHNYYMPQIGAADLQVFDSPSGALQRAEGLINPAFRVPAELATNKNMYTGANIKSDTHERNPVSNLGADFLSLLPGSDVGQTSRKVGGKNVSGPGANPYYAYMLGQIPMLRQVGLNYSGINKKRNTTNLLSYLGGQSVQNIDPAEQKMIESIKLQDQVKKEVTSLRDAGLMPRAKGRKSKHQKLIDQIAFGRESR
jgi:hypothetical protein